jgi:hypothetical protein
MKILNSSHISPFGGLNFVLNEFNALKIDKVLVDYLPLLPKQTKYSWKDILYSFWSIYFCGGDCIEDLGGNFHQHLKNNRFLSIPSPDRVLDRFKELSLPKDLFTVPRGTSLHQFSLHKPLNELNIQILKAIGLSKSQNHTLDYDNTLIFTNKADTTKSYKTRNGYCPGVAIIGNQIVFVENRNGNSDAKTLQYETLTRMFTLLEEQHIKIDAFRADGASYQLNIVELVSQHVNKFYLRACMSGALAKIIATINDWEKVDLGDEIGFRGEISFTPFIRTLKRNKQLDRLKTYRLVVTKIERDDKQVNMFTNEAYLYSAILTNDYEKTKNEVAGFYNQRGAIEREFDVLKNDFGWNNLPFSKLEQNTVFLIFTSICRNLYHYIITLFSKKFKGLKTSFRIKKFIFRFITIPAKWIRTSRQQKLRVYGNLHFKT